MAASLILRTVKGAPLTNLEVDNNFSNLNTWGNTINSNVGVLTNLTTAAKGNIVIAINELVTSNTTTNNNIGSIPSLATINKGNIVYAVNELKANIGVISNLVTYDTSNLVAAINELNTKATSNVTITRGNISGVVITNSTYNANTISIAYGGTGQTNQTAAINALLPSQTSNTNYFLRTNGSNVLWSSADITITNDTSTNATYYLSLTTASTGSINSANVSTSKLFFNPSTGLLTSTDYNSASDRNLKTNITNLSETIGILQQLQGVSFNWKDSGVKSFGLIAQDVEPIIPEIVTEHEGTKGINYINIIAFLIEAVKDLQSQIDQLKQQ
jgi:hypothetical protein